MSADILGMDAEARTKLAMTSVFVTPEGKARYTGKWRYIVVVRRFHLAEVHTPYVMMTLKRSGEASTIMAYMSSPEGRRMIRDRTPYVIDTVTGECVNAAHFLHGARYESGH